MFTIYSNAVLLIINYTSQHSNDTTNYYLSLQITIQLIDKPQFINDD